MRRQPSAAVIAIFVVVFFVCFVGEWLRYRLLKLVIGEKQSMEFGFKNSAEIRKLRKEVPRGELVKRMIVLDRALMIACAVGASTMLLWHFDIVQ